MRARRHRSYNDVSERRVTMPIVNGASVAVREQARLLAFAVQWPSTSVVLVSNGSCGSEAPGVSGAQQSRGASSGSVTDDEALPSCVEQFD